MTIDLNYIFSSLSILGNDPIYVFFSHLCWVSLTVRQKGNSCSANLLQMFPEVFHPAGTVSTCTSTYSPAAALYRFSITFWPLVGEYWPSSGKVHTGDGHPLAKWLINGSFSVGCRHHQGNWYSQQALSIWQRVPYLLIHAAPVFHRV
jgi:hypothetical protein